MSQPTLASVSALSVVPSDGRRLRVVDPRGRSDVPLVGYLVLAPEDTPPAELFASTVTVRRADPRQQPTAGPPRPAPRQVAQLPTARPAALGATADTETSPPDPVEHRGVVIDHERYVALLDGVELDLTYLEFELLAHLVAHPHRVHSRASLVSSVWGYDYPGDGRTVDVHIARLRRKLGGERRESIVTVRRVGYKYVPARR